VSAVLCSTRHEAGSDDDLEWPDTDMPSRVVFSRHSGERTENHQAGCRSAGDYAVDKDRLLSPTEFSGAYGPTAADGEQCCNRSELKKEHQATAVHGVDPNPDPRRRSCLNAERSFFSTTIRKVPTKNVRERDGVTA